MIDEHRRAFTAQYSDERYRQAVAAFEAVVGGGIPFRLAESPIFLPPALLQEMEDCAAAIIGQLSTPEAQAQVARLVPREWLFPNEDAHPTFVQFDFGLARGPDGGVKPMITEIQGFPSLYAFQLAMGRIWKDAFHLDPALRFLGEAPGEEDFGARLREAILGGQDPETVALVDVRPWQQGTWPDFTLTQRICPGLAVVDLLDLRRQGRRLVYRRDGREVPVRRLYNRVVWEELLAHEKEMGFSFHDDLDLEWAGHPNWFFKYSKASLPALRHPNVPRTIALDEVGAWPEPLSGFVLKPLYSFSGRGLKLDPTRADLEAIPERERAQYVLQEKFDWADAFVAPDGRPVRCEVRLMSVWTDRPVCLGTLPRMSRGLIMGCAYNTEPWTGHGIAFWP